MDRRTKRAKNYTTCKENVGKYFISLGSKLLQNDCSRELKSHLLHGKQAMTCVNDKPRQCVKNQRCHFANRGPYSQSYGLYIYKPCTNYMYM